MINSVRETFAMSSAAERLALSISSSILFMVRLHDIKVSPSPLIPSLSANSLSNFSLIFTAPSYEAFSLSNLLLRLPIYISCALEAASSSFIPCSLNDLYISEIPLKYLFSSPVSFALCIAALDASSL